MNYKLAAQRAFGAGLLLPRTQRRAFAITSSRLNPMSAKDAASQLLEKFSNTTLIRRQIIDGNQLQKLSLTLGRPVLDGVDVAASAPPAGTPVPPGYHLVYFTPNGIELELGPDGTDRTFNAPVPFTRRMWAGGKMTWAAARDSTQESPILRVGDEAEEHTKLVSAVAKTSRSAGEMVLVEVDKEIWGPRGLAMVDRRSWIFRPEVDPETVVEPPPLSSADLRSPSEEKDVEGENGVARHFRWSPTGLFRFSALTFNGHKIHFNEDWARKVESHPGLVVHGPLNLINILNYWRDVHGAGSIPKEITYRAMSPIYAGEAYQVHTGNVKDSEAGKIWEVLAKKGDAVCMRAEIIGH